jgi:hypothetical protein
LLTAESEEKAKVAVMEPSIATDSAAQEPIEEPYTARLLKAKQQADKQFPGRW